MPVRENTPERAGLRSAHPVSRPHLRSESREARDFSRAASLCTAETDSPLEETRFEPQVPHTKWRFFRDSTIHAWGPPLTSESGGLVTRGPMIRIPFAPAASQRLAGIRIPHVEKSGFPAGVCGP